MNQEKNSDLTGIHCNRRDLKKKNRSNKRALEKTSEGVGKSMTLIGMKTRTMRKKYIKALEAFKKWIRRKMGKNQLERTHHKQGSANKSR